MSPPQDQQPLQEIQRLDCTETGAHSWHGMSHPLDGKGVDLRLLGTGKKAKYSKTMYIKQFVTHIPRKRGDHPIGKNRHPKQKPCIGGGSASH